VLALALWLALEYQAPLPRAEWGWVALWLALGVVAHANEFELPRVINSTVWMSSGYALSAAAIATLPATGAMLVVAGSSCTLGQWRLLRKHPAAMLFNRGALALCAAAATLVYGAVAGSLPLAGHWPLVLGTLAASTVYFIANVGFVGTFAALRLGRPLRTPWLWPLPGSPGLLGNYLALGCFGDLLVATLRTGGWGTFGLALLPLAVTLVSLRQSARLHQRSEDIVLLLADSLDMRDRETGGHTARVEALALRLGRKLRLAGPELQDLRIAALLHDLGKIGISDMILHKPGPLTPTEWRAVRQHPEAGARLLAAHGLLQGAVPLIRHHHERFDGTGYPSGLPGEQIPLGARIIAVADSFTTMVDGRPYRLPLSPEAAMAELQACAGSQFDPQIVALLEPGDWSLAAASTPTGQGLPTPSPNGARRTSRAPGHVRA
jgi:hypothetical protein